MTCQDPRNRLVTSRGRDRAGYPGSTKGAGISPPAGGTFPAWLRDSDWRKICFGKEGPGSIPSGIVGWGGLGWVGGNREKLGFAGRNHWSASLEKGKEWSVEVPYQQDT